MRTPVTARPVAARPVTARPVTADLGRAGPRTVGELDVDQARRAALRAQGLLGATNRKSGVLGVLDRLGAVQLDTINVLARSHELVAYARLGPVGRAEVERCWWGAGRAVEYWSHAACLIPVEDWPLYAFRRRAFRQRGTRWHPVDPTTCTTVLARLTAEGPLTATELGGVRSRTAGGAGGWWDWSATKVAVEWLLDIGEVVCVRRDGWRRVYDLAGRTLPASVLGAELDDQTCLQHLVARAGAALGVADAADLADYQRITRRQVLDVVESSGLVPVRVHGWSGPAWAHPDALEALDRGGRHRRTLLSPFDSLVWDRRRTRRLFGMEHRLEAYLPASQRRRGYFSMPVLAGGRLIAQVDPRRDGMTLVAASVHLEQARGATARERDLDAVAGSLGEAARWIGAEAVRVDRVEPPDAAARLRARVR